MSVDEEGNATVAWFQWNASRNEIRANRFLSGQGWLGVEVLTNNSAPDAFEPWTASGYHGEAFVVWVEWDGRAFQIVAKRHDPAFGWGSNVVLHRTVDWPQYRPRVAADRQGNAHVVWEGWDGTRTRVYWARFSMQVGWESPLPIDRGAGGDGHYPELTVDGQGNVIVVWYAAAGITDIYATRYRPGFDWDPPILLETSGAGDAFDPVVASDDQGTGFVSWQQSDGTHWGVWATRYVPSAGWENATHLDGGTADAREPSVAIGATGTATVAWAQHTGMRTIIMSSRYRLGQGWGASEGVSETIPNSGSKPQVAVDATGRSLVVWTQASGPGSDIFASQSNAIGRWDSPVLISGGSATSRAPRIAIDKEGSGLAVWEETKGVPYSVWAAAYTAAPAPPPGPSPPLLDASGVVLLFLLLLVGAGFAAIAVWTVGRKRG